MSRRRKISIIGVIIFGLMILIPVIRHYQLRGATEAYVTELKGHGEPMELAQVLPPPVPPEQNSADTLRTADEMFGASFRAEKSLLETNFVYGARMVSPGKAMVLWQQPDIRDIDGTNSWENLTAAVMQNAKAFASLQQIIEKPAFGFPINYDQGVADLAFTNLHLVESKRSASRLETATLCALHQGDTALAAKNLRAMLALVKAMREERLAISELVRIAMVQIAFTANWEFLQSSNLTDKQLAELQQDWMGLDFIRSYESAMVMERVTERITAAKWRGSDSNLQNYLQIWTKLGLSDHEESGLDKLRVKTKVFLWRYWWSYPDEVRSLKIYQAFLGTVRIAETNYSFKTAIIHQKEELATLKLNQTNSYDDFFLNPAKADMHSILSQGVKSMSAVFDKVMKAETAKQIAITAIALKRYQLNHGKNPPDLNSLGPKFVSDVPLDPVDGQPLRYRLNADGTFLLYSVGENGVDDGGSPALESGVTSSTFNWQNPHALDWVWPQPATAAEIQKYYEEQAKKAE
ncbi:MAG: hypothetical protein P4N60_13155 [Verrucomicrobiae bacterium]|nr:hypothetical protein [Verrucomicrobiae bacterium]